MKRETFSDLWNYSSSLEGSAFIELIEECFCEMFVFSFQLHSVSPDAGILEEEGDDNSANSVGTTTGPANAEQLFTPSVSATCRAGIMTIKVRRHRLLLHSSQVLSNLDSGSGRFRSAELTLSQQRSCFCPLVLRMNPDLKVQYESSR